MRGFVTKRGGLVHVSKQASLWCCQLLDYFGYYLLVIDSFFSQVYIFAKCKV